MTIFEGVFAAIVIVFSIGIVGTVFSSLLEKFEKAAYTKKISEILTKDKWTIFDAGKIVVILIITFFIFYLIISISFEAIYLLFT